MLDKMFSLANSRLPHLIMWLFILNYRSHCQTLTKDEGDQLMDLFMKELATSVESEDQSSFLDFCITQREVCTEDQFTGDKALFNWRLSITPRFKERFWRAYKCVTTNQPSLCPVDGDWTEWTGWSRCDADCEDEGTQVRTRACENPRPTGGGDRCEGDSTLQRSCIGACIKSSDGRNEAKQYVEKIHEMYPDLKDTCLKSHCVFEQAKSFIKQPKKLSKYWSSLNCVKYAGACPVNGGFGEWSQWSECTGHCGWGQIVRKRKCDAPVTQNGGVFCQGDSFELDKCLNTNCNHGETFSDWSDYSACSETCGKYGTKTSTMACLFRKPCQLDGRMVSEITKTVPCFGGRCPNDGSWGYWGSWTECSAICGTGRRTRIRACDQPYPYGGQTCPGTATDVSGCTGDSCIQVPSEDDDDDDEDDDDLRRKRSPSLRFDTRQSKAVITRLDKPRRKVFTWNRHDTEGNRVVAERKIRGDVSLKEMRARRVPRSSLTYNGSDDENSSVDVNDPYIRPLDGGMESLYTKWGPWTPCSKSCGTGTRTRERRCKDRHTVCRGELKPVQFCNLDPCPVAGGWNSWQAWTPCGVTCGPGTQTRYRTCDNPLPSFGGSCLGLNSQAQHCIMPACKPEEEGEWTSWGDWSDCSASCGGGAKTKTKFRKSMSESQSQDAVCNIIPCPEDGLWGAWGGWSKCDRGCGLGNSYRDRTCTDPAPVYGGKPCQGSGTDLQRCFAGPCKDPDDVGVLFQGKGYIRYPPGPRPTLFLMVFLRFKAMRHKGILFHHTRSCRDTKPISCDLSILLKIFNNRLKLTSRLTEDGDSLHLSYPDAVYQNRWTDVIVVVTPKWAELKLNRGSRLVKRMPKKCPAVDLNGNLQVGLDKGGSGEGFHGMMSALRKNFRVLQLTSVTNYTGRGFPRHADGVTKISLPTAVRHQNMDGAYFSHLYFRRADHMHLKVILLASTHEGIIFFNGGNTSSSFFSLVLEGGVVKMCLSCESVPKCRSAYELKTGSWVVLTLTVRDKFATIRMNEGDAMQVMCTEGSNYRPRTSLYVGGARGNDWGVVVDLLKNDARFYGLVSAVYLNGVATSYKMATLIDKDGTVNSLGYSLSDNVKEVKSRHDSRVSLKCGEPESLKSDNYVRILWLKNTRLIEEDVHTEIVDVDSNSEYTSTLHLHPGKNHEGIYACLLSVDGELTVVEVFVVLDYAPAVHGDEEGRAEWIGFIVIFTMLFLFLIFAMLWIFFRDKMKKVIAKVKGQEEDEKGEDEAALLVDDTDGTGGTTDATDGEETSDAADTTGATDDPYSTMDPDDPYSSQRRSSQGRRSSHDRDYHDPYGDGDDPFADGNDPYADGDNYNPSELPKSETGTLSMYYTLEKHPAPGSKYYRSASSRIPTIPENKDDTIIVPVPKLVCLEKEHIIPPAKPKQKLTRNRASHLELYNSMDRQERANRDLISLVDRSEKCATIHKYYSPPGSTRSGSLFRRSAANGRPSTFYSQSPANRRTRTFYSQSPFDVQEDPAFDEHNQEERKLTTHYHIVSRRRLESTGRLQLPLVQSQKKKTHIPPEVPNLPEPACSPGLIPYVNTVNTLIQDHPRYKINSNYHNNTDQHDSNNTGVPDTDTDDGNQERKLERGKKKKMKKKERKRS